MKPFTSFLPLLFVASAAMPSASAQVDNGTVRFTLRGSTSLDAYTPVSPPRNVVGWFDQKVWRLTNYTPYWDSRLSWDSNAWVYIDLFGISNDSQLATQHPDWILKDSSGLPLYIPWGCSNGSCPNYAADFGNSGFRSYWINNASQILSKGYKGLWIDDVDMNPTIGNGQGTAMMPYDPRTGTTMTTSGWQQDMVGFLQQIRSSLPGYEIVHNSVWFAGGNSRDYNPYVIQQVQAADYINCERGVSDPGLTNGDGIWSVNAFLAYVDHVHSLGKNVIFEEYAYNGPYDLAGYFLIANGSDAEGNDSVTPYNWWNGYDVNLGPSLGPRYTWSGLLRRDFEHGMVLLNLPGNSAQWTNLPQKYVDLWGNTVTGVQIFGGEGAVLRTP